MLKLKVWLDGTQLKCLHTDPAYDHWCPVCNRNRELNKVKK